MSLTWSGFSPTMRMGQPQLQPLAPLSRSGYGWGDRDPQDKDGKPKEQQFTNVDVPFLGFCANVMTDSAPLSR
jgi:hypothetical protein